MVDRNREHREQSGSTGEPRDATHIDIQKKHHKRKVWPWLLGALAALLLIWGLPDLRRDREMAEVTETEEVQVQPPAEVAPAVPGTQPPSMASVQQFLGTAQRFATADAAQLQPLTADALSQLASALGSLAAGTPVESTVRPHLDKLTNAANQIRTAQWTADTHADQLHGAMAAGAQVLESIASTRAGTDATVSGQVAAVKSAASAVDAKRPVLQQRDGIQRYFTAAADAVRSIAGRT